MDSVTPIHNPSYTAFDSLSGAGAGETTTAMDNPSFSGTGETTTANDSILRSQKRPWGRPEVSKNRPRTPPPPLLETRLRRRETIPPALDTRFLNSMAAGVPIADDSILWAQNRSRGRPKGSKNKPKTSFDARFLNSWATGDPVDIDLVVGRVKRRVGRPKGSKNKPKTGLVESENTIGTTETVCYNPLTTPVFSESYESVNPGDLTDHAMQLYNNMKQQYEQQHHDWMMNNTNNDNAELYIPDLVFNESYESMNPGEFMEDAVQFYNNMKQQYDEQHHDRMMNNTNNDGLKTDEDIWLHLL